MNIFQPPLILELRATPGTREISASPQPSRTVDLRTPSRARKKNRRFPLTTVLDSPSFLSRERNFCPAAFQPLVRPAYLACFAIFPRGARRTASKFSWFSAISLPAQKSLRAPFGPYRRNLWIVNEASRCVSGEDPFWTFSKLIGSAEGRGASGAGGTTSFGISARDASGMINTLQGRGVGRRAPLCSNFSSVSRGYSSSWRKNKKMSAPRK